MKYLRSAAALTHSPRLPYACLRCARSGPLRARTARRTDRGEVAGMCGSGKGAGGAPRVHLVVVRLGRHHLAAPMRSLRARAHNALTVAAAVRHGVTHLLHRREDLHAEVARLAEKLTLFRHILVPPAEQLGPRALLRGAARRVAGARCVRLCARAGARRACAVHGRTGARAHTQMYACRYLYR